MTTRPISAGVAAELPLPDVVREQDDRIGAAGFFSGHEDTAEERVQAEHRKDCRRDARAL